MAYQDKIREMRISRGWTQQELAEKANIERVIISNLEANAGPRSIQRPSVDLLIKLAKAFEISLEAFLVDIGLMESNKGNKDAITKEMESIANDLNEIEKRLYQLSVKIRMSKLE